MLHEGLTAAAISPSFFMNRLRAGVYREVKAERSEGLLKNASSRDFDLDETRSDICRHRKKAASPTLHVVQVVVSSFPPAEAGRFLRDHQYFAEKKGNARVTPGWRPASLWERGKKEE